MVTTTTAISISMITSITIPPLLVLYVLRVRF